MIAAAAPQIADPLVRNLGTIGGSLTHCDPSGDLGAVMLAANARVVLKSKDAEREVADHRLPGRHVPVLDRAGRDPHPRQGDVALRQLRRHLPEAGAQGRRLRHRRRGHPAGDGRRHDQDRRHRPHQRRAHEHQGDRRRGVPGGPGPDRGSLRRGRAPGGRGLEPRGPTCGAARRTSGTWSRCTCGADWHGPPRSPARPESQGTGEDTRDGSHDHRQRHRRDPRHRTAAAPRPRPAREPAPDRHPHRLRLHQLRRLHGAGTTAPR